MNRGLTRTTVAVGFTLAVGACGTGGGGSSSRAQTRATVGVDQHRSQHRSRPDPRRRQWQDALPLRGEHEFAVNLHGRLCADVASVHDIRPTDSNRCCGGFVA